MSVICPLSLSLNATVTHPAYFPPLGTGADALSYTLNTDTGEQWVTITAKVRLCLVSRLLIQQVPNVANRTLSSFYLGDSNNVACSAFQTSTLDEATCEYTITLSNSWTSLRGCLGWETTESGDSIILKNYAFIEWIDLMEGLDGNERTQRTALEVTMNQQRDVIVESEAVPLTLEEPRLVITRVTYVPGSTTDGPRRFEMDWIMIAPCPLTPVLSNVSFALATTDSDTFATSNSTIDMGDMGDGLSFAASQDGTYSTSVDPSSPTNCTAGQRYYTVSGTLHINATSESVCYADGDYFFTFESRVWAPDESFTTGPSFVLQASIQDGFNLCAADSLDATVSATLEAIGAGPWTIGDKVTFQGNISTSGLPAAQIYLRQATVFNTKPEYSTARYPKDVFTSAIASLNAFGTATAFKSKFVASYAPGDNVETGAWQENHLSENTDATAFPAGTARPYLTQVTVFGGSSLSSSYLIPEDYGTTGLGFSLQLQWRVYFDLTTASLLGQRRRYLMQRDFAASYVGARDVSCSSQAGLVVANQVTINGVPSSTLSTGAIVGVAVAGVALVVAIAAVGVFVSRKRRNKSPAKSFDKETGLFMTK